MDAKNIKYLAVLLIFMCASTGIAYAYVAIKSNPMYINPRDKPTLLGIVSNDTPYVDEPITLTVTLSPSQSDVAIIFKYINGTAIGSSLTNSSGVATYNYTALSTSPVIIEAWTTV